MSYDVEGGGRECFEDGGIYGVGARGSLFGLLALLNSSGDMGISRFLAVVSGIFLAVLNHGVSLLGNEPLLYRFFQKFLNILFMSEGSLIDCLLLGSRAAVMLLLFVFLGLILLQNFLRSFLCWFMLLMKEAELFLWMLFSVSLLSLCFMFCLVLCRFLR